MPVENIAVFYTLSLECGSTFNDEAHLHFIEV
jgi:hypothetical protein